MQRRPGFTLVEMLVSVALVLFIMVILTEAFGKGLEGFRQMKALGDMESRLRTAAAMLRRDLGADHFEGKRRLSDDLTTWRMAGEPREGFFRHAYRNPVADYPRPASEGVDGDQIGSSHGAASVLHFTVKLRGNDRSQFFSAKAPARMLSSQPLDRTTFFNQPADARFQENGIYSGQWAEVAYFLEKTSQASAGSIPLYALYRSQLVIAADNQINWNTPLNDTVSNLAEISCRPVQQPVSTSDSVLHYLNNPTDINSKHEPADNLHPHRRAFNPVAPTLRAATVVLTDVLSLEVHQLELTSSGNYTPLREADTHRLRVSNGWSSPFTLEGGMRDLGITLRVWDAKTKQTRQLTLWQEF